MTALSSASRELWIAIAAWEAMDAMKSSSKLESTGRDVVPSDLRGTLSYKYTSPIGIYVAPAFSFGQTFNSQKYSVRTSDGKTLTNAFWGGLNVGY